MPSYLIWRARVCAMFVKNWVAEDRTRCREVVRQSSIMLLHPTPATGQVFSAYAYFFDYDLSNMRTVQNMINVFERWFYRRMLPHLTDGTCHQRGGVYRGQQKPTLLDGLPKRRLAFHGHIIRKGGITLDLMTGCIHGTRPRVRPSTWRTSLNKLTSIAQR